MSLIFAVVSPSSCEQLEGVESLLVSLWAVLCFCTLGGVETEGISTAWDLIIKNKKLQMLIWFCMVWRTQNVGFLWRLPKTPLLPLHTDVKLVFSRGQWHVGCETHLRPYKRQGRASLCHESRPPGPPSLATGGGTSARPPLFTGCCSPPPFWVGSGGAAFQAYSWENKPVADLSLWCWHNSISSPAHWAAWWLGRAL